MTLIDASGHQLVLTVRRYGVLTSFYPWPRTLLTCLNSVSLAWLQELTYTFADYIFLGRMFA